MVVTWRYRSWIKTPFDTQNGALVSIDSFFNFPSFSYKIKFPCKKNYQFFISNLKLINLPSVDPSTKCSLVEVERFDAINKLYNFKHLTVWDYINNLIYFLVEIVQMWQKLILTIRATQIFLQFQLSNEKFSDRHHTKLFRHTNTTLDRWRNFDASTAMCAF